MVVGHCVTLREDIIVPPVTTISIVVGAQVTPVVLDVYRKRRGEFKV